MKLRVETNKPNMQNELEEVIRAFAPYAVFDPLGEVISAEISEFSSSARTSIRSSLAPEISREYELSDDLTDLMRKRLVKRYLKRDLYDYLCLLTGKTLSYGSLTGIRPTKLYYELESEGVSPEERLSDFFRVSPGKVRLLSDIVRTQRGVIGAETEKVDWFVNIPFCPTRCAYCSFLSEVIRPKKSNLPAYTDALIRDILAVPSGRPRRAIYVGGGTPTSLPPDLLDRILAAIDAHGEEFTVEAGRPETLSEEKVAVLAARGVTRVSVNPQSFKQETLDLIGRRHTVEDIFHAYDLVRRGGAFDVNMDFITMLPGETFEDFRRSIEIAIDLSPENVTVHSLSVKRGSVFAESGYDNHSDTLAERMSDFARSALEGAGYRPYYIYRQKNTSGRQENVGYAKEGKVCRYNVDIMEETHDIYASGAGAISKRLFGNGRIERLAEVKEIKGYLERIDELIRKKIVFFKD
ncbi:MAG: coproporphyrinogen dehydrogenase HemZ [Clostridia bacterium]|nr:coproporphyrinogen dehydrogenase HemZ [Clostridia bacterium]